MYRITLGWGLLLSALVIAFGTHVFRPTAEARRAAEAQAGPRYTVVETEGTNLVVVDNTTNVLYFYTVDPEKEVGADLHLRGSIDLKDVGKAVLKPRKTNK